MKSKVIKDPERLLKLSSELKPTSFRLLLFLMITRKPKVPFYLTLWGLSKESLIKNPTRPLQELIDRKLVKKETEDSKCKYTLLIDLIK